jgi:hypothetical protein
MGHAVGPRYWEDQTSEKEATSVAEIPSVPVPVYVAGCAIGCKVWRSYSHLVAQQAALAHHERTGHAVEVVERYGEATPQSGDPDA